MEASLAINDAGTPFLGLAESETKPIARKPPDLDLVLQYLERPIQVGIWRLRLLWQPTGGVSNSVLQQVQSALVTGKPIKVVTPKVTSEFLLTDELVAAALECIRNRITFVFQL